MARFCRFSSLITPEIPEKCDIGKYTLQTKELGVYADFIWFFSFSPVKRSQSSFKEQIGESQMRPLNIYGPLFIFFPDCGCNFHKDLMVKQVKHPSFWMLLEGCLTPAEQVPWAALDQTVPSMLRGFPYPCANKPLIYCPECICWPHLNWWWLGQN